MNRALALLLFPILLLACSHSLQKTEKPPSREPDSVGGHYPYSLENLLQRDDPRASAKTAVERLLKIQIRASSWVAEIDKRFQKADGPVELFSLPAYRRLLATRSLVDRIEHRLVETYSEARELAEAENRDPGGRNDRAADVVAGFRDALRAIGKNPVRQVLLHNLLRAFKERRRERGSEKPMAEPLPRDKLAEMAAITAPEIASFFPALPERDESVDEVDGELENFTFDAGEGREPQSLNVFPSAGPNGNISGPSFPMGTWALTFDDGPHAAITERGVKVLREGGVKGTFFWLAQNIKRLPEVVRAVRAAGMPLENHSWSHPNLADAKKLAEAHTSLDREITQSTAVEAEAYGGKPRFFRCPYGAGIHNAAVRELIAKEGMIHVGWNVDSLDWHDKNPASVLARVERQMALTKRGIILFHDVHPIAPIVVKELLERKKGTARWVTIPEITDELNGIKR
jgi:peptidoglycan/xylan/chitin deacetylase (PgdA/CDA1 family)